MKKRLQAVAAICLTMFCCSAAASEPFPKVSKPYAVTKGPHEHFFANYYAINAWSKDNRYIGVLETDINGRLPDADERCTLGLVDLQDENKFIPVTTTACWNFQEAAMFHWLEWADDTFVYNDVTDGVFSAVVLNWKTGVRTVFKGRPISAVSPDGVWALSVNYARIRFTRPDYGYAGNGQDPQREIAWPEKDGLWLFNLREASVAPRLIVSVSSQKDVMTKMTDPRGMAYFCHTVFSKDGKRIFWLARTVENLDKQKRVGRWDTTSLVCNVDGSNVRRCFPDGWKGSHFNWMDGETMVVTAAWKANKKVWNHVLFKAGDQSTLHRMGGGLLDWDGHCVFTPNKKFMSTDGYWDAFGERKLVFVRLSDEAVLPVGTFFVPEKYREQYSRCDLHTRWRPDGAQLGFNSVHENSRQVYLINVRW